MKQVLIFLVLFFALLIPFSQVSSAQIYNEDYSKLQKINTFKENNVWIVYGWTFLYPKGKRERNGRKSSFERFDRDGNRTEEVHYDNKGNTDFSCEYVYDEKGNQIRKIGNTGPEVIYEQWHYISNEDGKKAERKSEFKKLKNEKWVYLFDSQQNITTETYYDISGVMTCKWEFVYNEKQNLTLKTECDPYGNIYQKWVYIYDNRGNNTEMRHYISNNQLYRIYEMRYDKKGNMKSKFTFDKNENIIDLAVYIYQFYDGLYAPRVMGNKM